MVNIRRLKKGDILKTLVDYPNFGLKRYDTVKVLSTGYSRWDGEYYADVITDNNYKIEIMKNFKDFVLIN